MKKPGDINARAQEKKEISTVKLRQKVNADIQPKSPRSEIDTPPAKANQLAGQIDVCNPDMIEGWLADLSRPNNRCTVAAIRDGRVISETIAQNYRQDLVSAKIGDGKYGFQLPVPSRLAGGGHLEIIDKETGTPIKGSPVPVASLELEDTKAQQPLLLVDLSDMIFYLEHHDHLSGIQRVQANIFSAIIENALYPISRIKVVYYKEGEQAFYEMPVWFIENLIGDTQKNIADRQFKRRPDGRLHLEEQGQIKALSMTEADQENSALLMLGAAWVFPSYFYAVRKLRKNGTRFIPLLHDLIPIVLPTMCDKGTAEVFKIFIKRLIRNADHVLTVSEHTRRDFIDFCAAQKIENPPVTVAQNGQSFGKPKKRHEASPVQGPFVLYVSTIEGRKNHKLALQIWQQLVQERGDAVPTLVFVGRLGWRVEGLVEQLEESNYLNQKVVILSEVSDGVLAALYQNCLFTIYPSLYEGWGLPVGESLAFGKACLASNASSIPEAGGDLAVYFDPSDTADAIKKTKRLIDDHAWRTKIERDIAAKFKPISWVDSASSAISAISSFEIKPERSIIPTLGCGEYNFARISYIESNIVHGDEVTRHLREISEPKLTFNRLTLNHYIAAEESLGDGIWYHPEPFGRWGHKDGNSINFRVPNSEKNYYAVFEIHIPHVFLPAVIETSYHGRVMSTHSTPKEVTLIRLETNSYSQDGIIDISLKLKKTARDRVDGDPRRLGLGISRLVVLEADSVEQRLELIERRMFN